MVKPAGKVLRGDVEFQLEKTYRPVPVLFDRNKYTRNAVMRISAPEETVSPNVKIHLAWDTVSQSCIQKRVD